MTDPTGGITRPTAMSWTEYSLAVMREWQDLLDSDPMESAVQTFLELHPSMIPGGRGEVGHGGHHGSEMTAVFREPELIGAGRKRQPDFMWVTRSTGCITPVLIEIEKPSKRWFTLAGTLTADFTQAQGQLNDWRAWFASPENQILFRRRYLFQQQYMDRPIRPRYLLIYGRRSEFEPGVVHKNASELRFKRDGALRPDESFITFDSLRPDYELSSAVTVTMTSNGPRAFAFSPTYSTNQQSGKDAEILGRDVADAFKRSAMMSPDRKRYLVERWHHWHDESLRRSSWAPVDLTSFLYPE